MKPSEILLSTALVVIAVLATSLWFIRAQSGDLIRSKDAAVSALQSNLDSTEGDLAKNKALLDTQAATIKTLNETLQSKEDIIAKNNDLLQADDGTIKGLHDTIDSQQQVIARDNDILYSFRHPVVAPQPPTIGPRTSEPKNKIADGSTDNMEPGGKKIYPADNGFDAQDLGAGFNSFQVFGPLYNPNGNSYLPRIPNHTPWKFGSGNSGIAANGSGYFVTGATNQDSDGKTSTSGQAGSLEYEGSSISQDVILPAGTYSFMFDFEGRPQYTPNRVAVFVDDTMVFDGTPTSTQNFQKVSSNAITFKEPGKHELRFLALGGVDENSPYPATFIDNICFNALTPKKLGKAQDPDTTTKSLTPPAPPDPPQAVKKVANVESQQRLPGAEFHKAEGHDFTPMLPSATRSAF
jgi:hypothetical protein